jgi:hypothetical protein
VPSSFFHFETPIFGGQHPGNLIQGDGSLYRISGQ